MRGDRWGWGIVPVVVAAVAAGPLAGQDHGELRDRLSEVLDSLRATTGIAGVSLGVVLPDGAVLGVVSGTEDRAGTRPLPVEGLFLSGSVGKTYFAATALQLVEEGRLGLDDRVADHLGHFEWWPRIPNADGMTVRQLLQHRSGLARYVMDPAFLQRLSDDPRGTFTLPERLEFAIDDGPLFAPGEGWSYADTNYLLVAAVIESVTGEAAYDEIRRRFLAPLALRETRPSDRPDLPGLVMGHAGPQNPFGSFDETLDATGTLVLNPQVEWAGGGFASSARDLARWMRAFQTGSIFDDPSTLTEARVAVDAPLGPGGRYGLGMIGLTLPAGEAWGHSGFMPGYLTEAYHFPAAGVTMALMVNSSDRGEVTTPPLRLLNAIAEVIVGAGRLP